MTLADDAAQRRARARREVARRLHPDLGGDPDEFIRAMRDIDGPPAPPPPHPPVTVFRTGVRRWRSPRRRRTSLPGWVPGVRRYTQLD